MRHTFLNVLLNISLSSLLLQNARHTVLNHHFTYYSGIESIERTLRQSLNLTGINSQKSNSDRGLRPARGPKSNNFEIVDHRIYSCLLSNLALIETSCHHVNFIIINSN